MKLYNIFKEVILEEIQKNSQLITEGVSEELVKDARIEGQSSPVYQYCLDIMQKGSDFINYSIQKTSSGEVVKLGIK